MQKMGKKIIAWILLITMIISGTSIQQIFAIDNIPTAKNQIIADSGNETISIIHKDTNIPTTELQVHDASFNIERDYDQSVDVYVSNASDKDVEFYLAAENKYSDLYLNFTKSGSIDEPLTIKAGETKTVELSVFAQNADRVSHDITVNSYIIENKAEHLADTAKITINVAQQPFNVSISAGEKDPHTLAQAFTIKNNSPDKITDLSLRLSGDIENYCSISPIVDNYEIDKNAEITVEVIPDLSKFKQENITSINGQLEAYSGSNSTKADISFDTNGAEITDISITQLGLLQEGNPFWNMELDYKTVEFKTKDGTTMRELSAEYYEEGNPDKQGIKTPEQAEEALSKIIDADGSMFLSIEGDMTYDENKRLPLGFGMSSEKVSDNSEIPEPVNGVRLDTVYKYSEETDDFTVSTVIYLNKAEYADYLDGMKNQIYSNLGLIRASSVSAEYAVQTLEDDEEEWWKVALDVIFGDAVSLGLEFTTLKNEDFNDFFNKLVSDDGISMDDFYKYMPDPDLADEFTSKFFDIVTDSDVIKFTDAIGKFSDILGGFSLAYNIYNIWDKDVDENGNEIDTVDKGIDTALTICAEVAKYFAGDAIMGACISAGAAFDGPGIIAGAIIGIAANYGAGKIIDFLGDKIGEFGSYLYHEVFPVLGEQCTNAGQTLVNWFMSLFRKNRMALAYEAETDGSGNFYITSRMSNGSPYGGNPGYADDNFGGWEYQHVLPVSYTYYVNGKKAGESKSVGLTELDIISIPMDYLQEGQNTVLKKYSTNAGHYKVVADTQITVPVPADKRMAYIGSPDDLADVRSLPDFAVYNENIVISDKDMVSSEANKVNANIYNRGSRGSWVNIVATDSSREKFREDKVYIEAFSVHPIEFEWIPIEGANTITINLTNSSKFIDERDLTNNTASVTVPARKREVPTISEITVGNGNIYAEETAVFTADVTNITDIKEIKYSIDGGIEQSANVSNLSDKIRVSAEVMFETSGTHNIKFNVVYNTSKTETSNISKTTEVTVLPTRNMKFEVLPVNATGMQFYLYKIETGVTPVKIPIEVDSIGNGKYALVLDDEVLKDTSKYYLLVTSDNGADFKQLNAVINGESLTLQNGVMPVSGVVTLAETTNKDVITSDSAISFNIQPKDMGLNYFYLYTIQASSNVEETDFDIIKTETGEYSLKIANEILPELKNCYLLVTSDGGNAFISVDKAIQSEVVTLSDKDTYLLNDDRIIAETPMKNRDSDFTYNGKLSLYDSSFKENYGGDTIHLKVSNLVDNHGNPYNNDNLNALYGNFILTGSPDTNKSYNIPVVIYNLEDFTVQLPNDSKVNGQYTFSVELEQDILFALTVSSAEGGTVNTNANGKYVSGTNINIIATANQGYCFKNWTSTNGGIFANENSASTIFTMPANDTTIKANFEKLPSYTITTKSGTGGSVSEGGTFTVGTQVTLVAKPNSNYSFDGWYEDNKKIEGANAEYSFAVTADRTLEARFSPVPLYTITTKSSKGGSVSEGGTFTVGTRITLIAEPNLNYNFSGWYEDNKKIEEADAEYSFTVTADRTLEARFSRISSRRSSGGGSSANISYERATETTTETIAEASTEGILSNNVRVTIGSKKVEIGNKTYDMSVAPYIQSNSNSTLVPLRFVALAIYGGDVNQADNSSIIKWNPDTKTATITANNKIIEFTANSENIIVNGQTIVMEYGVKAEIKNERMFIPFRALGKALDVDVVWDVDTKTATYLSEKNA